jgi:hypothetical protein
MVAEDHTRLGHPIPLQQTLPYIAIDRHSRFDGKRRHLVVDCGYGVGCGLSRLEENRNYKIQEGEMKGRGRGSGD